MRGGKSTYGNCDFLLSWHIKNGMADQYPVSGLNIAMAGTYSDNDPTEAWHVILYVDESADDVQKGALENIFLGRAKGTPFRNFASAITEVISVTQARIELIHAKNEERIRIGTRASAATGKPVQSEVGVSCGIPGHDQPGQVVADYFRVNDGPFVWNFEGRCGFATNFSYRND
jgi:hypothetical protein